MAGKTSSRLRPNLGFVLVVLGAGVGAILGAAAVFFTPLGRSHAAPGAADGAFRVAVVSPDAGGTEPARPVDKETATKRVQVKWEGDAARWYPIAIHLLTQLVTTDAPPEFVTEWLMPFTLDLVRAQPDPLAFVREMGGVGG